MINFQEWLEEKDPDTYNELFGINRDTVTDMIKKPFQRSTVSSNARPFNAEEKAKLAQLQGKTTKPAVLSYKDRRPNRTVVDPSEIQWRG